RAKSSSSRRTGGARRGSDPGAVVEQAHRLLSHAADEGVPVVVHTLTPGLEALLDAFAPQLGAETPAVEVISTAVLERARRKRVWPAPGEEDADSSLRAAELEGPVPDLRACLDEPRCPVASWIPEDEFFTARATDMLFRRRQRRFRRGGPDPC